MGPMEQPTDGTYGGDDMMMMPPTGGAGGCCANFVSRCPSVASKSTKSTGKKAVRKSKALSKAAIDVRARINSKKASGAAKKDMSMDMPPMDMYYGSGAGMGSGPMEMPPMDK